MSFRDDLISHLQHYDRDGIWSDADRDLEGIEPLTAEEAVPIVARWACDELSGDLNTGTVPGSIKCFEDLHEYVDANEYGGASSMRSDGSPDFDAFWNAVQDAVDAWIKRGCNQDEIVNGEPFPTGPTPRLISRTVDGVRAWLRALWDRQLLWHMEDDAKDCFPEGDAVTILSASQNDAWAVCELAGVDIFEQYPAESMPSDD